MKIEFDTTTYDIVVDGKEVSTLDDDVRRNIWLRASSYIRQNPRPKELYPFLQYVMLFHGEKNNNVYSLDI